MKPSDQKIKRARRTQTRPTKSTSSHVKARKSILYTNFAIYHNLGTTCPIIYTLGNTSVLSPSCRSSSPPQWKIQVHTHSPFPLNVKHLNLKAPHANVNFFPVSEIPIIIHRLTQSTPSIQRATLERYFTPDCSFTHPFCRTGSFNGSRWLMWCIYRWYKILSPRIELEVLSVGMFISCHVKEIETETLN